MFLFFKNFHWVLERRFFILCFGKENFFHCGRSYVIENLSLCIEKIEQNCWGPILICTWYVTVLGLLLLLLFCGFQHGPGFYT